MLLSPVVTLLPANVPTAWDDFCQGGPACYFYLGAMNLKRQSLGHGPVAFRDPNGTPTGNPVPATAPVAGNGVENQKHSASPPLAGRGC